MGNATLFLILAKYNKMQLHQMDEQIKRLLLLTLLQ